MKKSIWILSAAAALLLSACNDYVGKEKSHPLFIKAGKEKSAGEYKEAARCYEEFLLICPKSSLTHHELGNIYSDYLNDPLKAVYHYRKWMEMNPNDKTNFEDVRLLAETAQKNLFKNLKEEYKDSAENKQTAEEMQKLKDELAQTQNRLKLSEEQNQKMKEILLSVKAEREKINAQTMAKNKQNLTQKSSSIQKTTPSNTVQPKTAQIQPVPPDAKGKTYKVQPGDNLSKISRKCYGSAKYYTLIAEANKGKLGPKMQVRVGQLLVIPPQPKH